jgi:hypothetical protein
MFTILMLTGYWGSAAYAQSPKNHYRSIEIARFNVEPGTEVPPDFVVAVMNDLTEQLRKTNKFEMVFREEGGLTSAPTPALKLSGAIKEFKKGSRAKRYLIGFGAGKTKIAAHVRFTDRETGEVLFEDDVDGKVVIGAFGGDSMGAARGLAKEVGKVTKKQFFN